MVCIGPCEKCVSGFHITASEYLALIASNLEVDGRVVPIEEILRTESHLALLGAQLCRDGFHIGLRSKLVQKFIELKISLLGMLRIIRCIEVMQTGCRTVVHVSG